MKKVNLLDYFELAEAVTRAKATTSQEQNKESSIWIGTNFLAEKMRKFATDDNGFSACKYAATKLADSIEIWIRDNINDRDDSSIFNNENFDKTFDQWRYWSISSNIDSFKNVFEAECRDVDVYSVGDISIYKTSTLVSRGSTIIPVEMHSIIPNSALDELDSSGKCLAFDLPTACGFHALRAVEVVMDAYLQNFGIDTSPIKSWNEYIKAAEKFIHPDSSERRPSAKVTAMLDRMRQLDRNPLMHPQDTLDSVQADMLFKLCAITVVEMARDMALSPHSEIEGQETSPPPSDLIGRQPNSNHR